MNADFGGLGVSCALSIATDSVKVMRTIACRPSVMTSKSDVKSRTKRWSALADDFRTYLLTSFASESLLEQAGALG
jgi:hypothetical protein